MAQSMRIVNPSRTTETGMTRSFEQMYTQRLMPITTVRRLSAYPSTRRLCSMHCYRQEKAREKELVGLGSSVDYPQWRDTAKTPGCRSYAPTVDGEAFSIPNAAHAGLAEMKSMFRKSPQRSHSSLGSPSSSKNMVNSMDSSTLSEGGWDGGVGSPMTVWKEESHVSSMSNPQSQPAERNNTASGERKGEWIGLLSVLLVRGENLKVHYVNNNHKAFDAGQTNPIVSVMLSGGRVQRSGLIKKDINPEFDEELLWDFYERDAGERGLKFEVHWHDLRTGEECHVGAGEMGTDKLAGKGAVDEEIHIVSQSPDAVCKGTLTVQVRLLPADSMPGGDALRPRASTPHWWNASHASTGLVKTPIYRQGGTTRAPPSTPLLPPSPTKMLRMQGTNGPGSPPSAAQGSDITVRVRGWDKTNTKVIYKTDTTGVRGGGLSGLIPASKRNEQRENMLAQFFAKSNLADQAMHMVRSMRSKGIPVWQSTIDGVSQCAESSWAHKTGGTGPDQSHQG
jgi:hypothetical protein